MITLPRPTREVVHQPTREVVPRHELQPLIDELSELTDGRDDIRVECAGTMAGYWFASPGMAQGHELIAAGLLLLAGPPDTDLLLRWISIGFSRKAGERPYQPVK